MRAQPIACLSALESPSQIDASLPARLPGSDIYGMIQSSRHSVELVSATRGYSQGKSASDTKGPF